MIDWTWLSRHTNAASSMYLNQLTKLTTWSTILKASEGIAYWFPYTSVCQLLFLAFVFLFKTLFRFQRHQWSDREINWTLAHLASPSFLTRIKILRNPTPVYNRLSAEIEPQISIFHVLIIWACNSGKDADYPRAFRYQRSALWQTRGRWFSVTCLINASIHRWLRFSQPPEIRCRKKHPYAQSRQRQNCVSAYSIFVPTKKNLWTTKHLCYSAQNATWSVKTKRFDTKFLLSDDTCRTIHRYVTSTRVQRAGCGISERLVIS